MSFDSKDQFYKLDLYHTPKQDETWPTPDTCQLDQPNFYFFNSCGVQCCLHVTQLIHRDTVTWYQVIFSIKVSGVDGSYLVELVEMHASWSVHHGF